MTMKANCPPEFCENQASAREMVNCDQEAWLLHRLASLVRMALSLQRNRRVVADEPAYNSAMDGLLHGTAVEIIHTLGMEPEYTNLRHVPNDPIHVYDPRDAFR